MIRAHIFISGDVIGVGFRAWADAQVKNLNLTGWVSNDYPKVEAVFEGKKEDVEKMVELCRHGPEVGFVEKVEIKWKEFTGEFEGFTINK